MRKLRWQLIIIILTGLVVGILLLSEQPVIQQLIPEPTRGGIYTEALVGTPQRYNPLLDSFNSVDRDVNKLLFSGLLTIGDRGIPEPDLAESWGISKDGNIYNFELRPNVSWHDGQPLTTDDILFTIDLIRQGGDIVRSDLKDFWSNVEVEALSSTTIQFRLPEPFAPFTDYLTFGILPKHLLGNYSMADIINNPFNLAPVGSGPFRFEELITTDGKIDGIILKVFDGYYKDSKPFLEQINFLYYPTATDALQAYREGTVQGISRIPADLIPEALKEENLAIYTVSSPELKMILLNNNNPDVPFLQEPVVRKALLQAINRQWIINNIMNSQAISASGPILPGTWAYYGDLDQVDFNLDEAIDTLQFDGYLISGESGDVRVKEGVSLEFELLYPENEQDRLIAETIQANWEKLGVKVSLTSLPYDALINEKLELRDYQAALVDINFSKTPDPDPYPFWDQAQATGGQNYTQWDNRTASEHIEEARITNDLSDRARLYRNFQVIFAEELPALPLFYPVYNYAVDYQIQGVSLGPLFDSSDRFAKITNWFMVTRRQAQTSATESASTE